MSKVKSLQIFRKKQAVFCILFFISSSLILRTIHHHHIYDCIKDLDFDYDTELSDQEFQNAPEQ